MNSPLSAQAFEGAFASRVNPRTQILAGPDALVAAVGSLLPSPGGLIVGRFGFSDQATGRVSNARQAASDRLGFVIANPTPGVPNTWQRTYTARLNGQNVRVLRPGLGVTVCNRGDFWGRFSGGASPGMAVYASPLDGSLIAGYVDGAELTPWSVITTVQPGALGIISTWSNF